MLCEHKCGRKIQTLVGYLLTENEKTLLPLVQKEIFEAVNTDVSVWEGKQWDGEVRRGEARRGAEVILQQRVQYVCPMKPSNTVSTLSVTTSECTITFYKGRMKCQNWFERGGLRYKWAAKVAILFHWPFIPRVPGSLAGEKKKEKEQREHEVGVGGRHASLRWQHVKWKPHTHTHTKQAEIKEEEEEEKKQARGNARGVV